MNTFEKAKLALRKNLLENKERVLADLTEMRKKSVGNDIFHYLDALSQSVYLNNIIVQKQTFVFEELFEPIEYYQVFGGASPTFQPPNPFARKVKKGSVCLTEPFF